MVAEQSGGFSGGLQRAGPLHGTGDQHVAWTSHHIVLTVMTPSLTAAGVAAAASALLLVSVLVVVAVFVIAHVSSLHFLTGGWIYLVGEGLRCPRRSSGRLVASALAEF